MIEIKEGRYNNEVFIKIDGLSASLKKAIHEQLFEIGQSHVVRTKHLIFKRKTGRIYVINGKFHQASAPYEPPANLTGALAANVDYVVRGASELEFGDKKQPGKAPYGLFLEKGTRKMKPRPHLSRAVKAEHKNTFQSLQRAQIQAYFM